MHTKHELEMLEATLAWCNEQRALKNLEQLAQLPAGERHDPTSCPCGAATGLWVGRFNFGENSEDAAKSGNRLPQLVRDFTVAFDDGLFPELDAYLNQEPA